MSIFLDEIRNVILLFSNPSWKGVSTVSGTVVRNITALSNGMVYSARFSGNTTVLSDRYAAEGVISGLVHVPDIPLGHSCKLETAPHVPHTAVRLANLPPTYYHLIAIAPWVNGRCSDAYLAAARATPVRAFLFYMPGNASAQPPPPDSPRWHIRGNSDWMSQTGYPVFALSGMAGEVMMQHLSLYSGNMTEVPFGDYIADRFLGDPEDYLRIWTELHIGTLPVGLATWVYLLIILGVLLCVVIGTSVLMHSVQAWWRVSLRRRVISGEVNLEAMGITRLTVPTARIEKFPLFTYRYEPKTWNDPSPPPPARPARLETRTSRLNRNENTMADEITRPPTVPELRLGSPYDSLSTATDCQPRCEICLEHYENRKTVIRELPCGHIFHPECIDPFLHEISSLCPICKSSTLPQGYCPRITNDMVRRERAIRHLRDRVEDQSDNDLSNAGKPQGRRMSTRSRRFGKKNSPLSPPSIELHEIRTGPQDRPQQEVRTQSGPPPSQGSSLASPGMPTASAIGRMPQFAGVGPEHEGELTRWQRLRTRIFPGFH